MNRKKEIAGYVMMVVLALVIALIINYLVILRVEIPTNSMENTIMAGSRVVVLRPAYLFSDPKRGDIVVFKYPDDETQNYAKRIIGLPGETIEIRDGLVYVNGFEEPLEEDYLKETPTGSYGPYEVPEDSYFMLGITERCRRIRDSGRIPMSGGIKLSGEYGLSIILPSIFTGKNPRNGPFPSLSEFCDANRRLFGMILPG